MSIPHSPSPPLTHSSSPSPTPPLPRSPTPLPVLLPLAILISLYWIGRYGGYAMEVDASRITRAADGILHTNNLVHPKSYPAGHAYPALLVFATRLTSLDIQPLQLNAGLWLPVLLLGVYICYREFLEDDLTAGFAAFLLLLQPDFLFYILRSSHEKITWFLTVLLVFALARLAHFVDRPSKRHWYTTLFCLLLWGLVTTNAFFASTVLLALAFYTFSAWALQAMLARTSAPGGRGPYLVCSLRLCLIGAALVLIFIELLYPPARAYWDVLRSFHAQITAFLSGETFKQPYAYVATAWRSPWVYGFLTAPQWLFVLAGVTGWFSGLKRLPSAGQKVWLLWLLTAAFASLLSVGVLADLAGFLSLNLQVRLFPPFALLLTPIAAGQISHWLQRNPLNRPVLRLGPVILTSYALLACLLKVTNDPLAGNQWVFYAPSEMASLRWIDSHLTNGRVWSGLSPHQGEVMDFLSGYSDWRHNTYEYGDIDSPPEILLISGITQFRAGRIGKDLPGTFDHNRIYDNGVVQIHRRKPLTPFQK